MLIRFKLSVSVAFSTFVAYYLASDYLRFTAFYLTAGLWVLASGASALNQIQERTSDAKMRRTHLRPIPNKTLSLRTAWIITCLFILTGLGVLFISGGYISFAAGVFSLLWYNGLYTRLKRNTVFAMIPGTLTGVIPIFIGWQAAGGSLTNQLFLFMCLFMMVWQLPHFILLMLKFKDDYRKAGFPTLTDRYRTVMVKDIISSGVIALLTVCGGM